LANTAGTPRRRAGRPPKPQDGSTSALAALGVQLRSLRNERDWTLHALAQHTGYSPQHIGAVERATVVPSEALITACDTALLANGQLINTHAAVIQEQAHTRSHNLLARRRRDGAPVSVEAARAGNAMALTSNTISEVGRDRRVLTPELEGIHAAIPRLRHALDRIDIPEDGPTRARAVLHAEIVRVSEDRLQSRYGTLVHRLPDLITELARAGQSQDARLRRDAAALQTLALRAADGVAFKFGYLDLSARLIDVMRWAAQSAEDPLLLAAVAYVRTETFFATGELDTAARALEVAADQIPAANTAPSVAAFGALHMRAAVVAARAGIADRAIEHLHEARQAAQTVPEGTYYGTAFGPASLRIHELSVAAELHDPIGIERAAAWQPPQELPAERRSHYYIDLARAQLTQDRNQDAFLCLQTARQTAPEHTRAHPQVRQSLMQLVKAKRSPSTELLEFAEWTGVHDSARPVILGSSSPGRSSSESITQLASRRTTGSSAHR